MAAVNDRGGRPYKRRKKNSNAGVAGILIVVCLLAAVLAFASISLYGTLKSDEARRAQLLLAIDEENERTKQIEARRDFMTTDEFVKQAARDRLGLVEEGEIIFRRSE